MARGNDSWSFHYASSLSSSQFSVAFKRGFAENNSVSIQNVKDVKVGRADKFEVREVVGCAEDFRSLLGNNHEDGFVSEFQVVQLLGNFFSFAGGRDTLNNDSLVGVLEA